MESKGNYFYVKKCNLEKNYTKIPNNIFYLKLTASEKLILIYLMSNSEDFRVTVYRIRKSLKMHNETVKDALNNLHKLKIISYINCSTIKVNINEFENHIQSSTANDTLNTGTSTPSDSTPNDTTTSTPSELPLVTEVNHTSTPIDSKIVPQVNNNNTNEQDQEKKNTKEELTKRSGFDDFGGGVPVPVPLAAPPLGSLAPPTPTHTPSSDDKDDITKVNKPVETNHTPIKDSERSVTEAETTTLLVSDEVQLAKSISYNKDLQSKYFGMSLNKQMLRLYMNSSLDVKNSLTYHQFEELFQCINIMKRLKGTEINRGYVINELLENFGEISTFIMKYIPRNVETYKKSEAEYSVALQDYRL